MDRRRLLIGLTALATLQVACQRNAEDVLRVAVAKGGVAPQLIKDFTATLAETEALKVMTQPSLVELFQQLQRWHELTQVPEDNTRIQSAADWVSLSDYWLLPAIQQALISPLEDYQNLQWETLPANWLTLLQRNSEGLLAASGAVWGTPYRWEHLMMVYDRRTFSQFGWEPQAWTDLLRPELQQRLALPDHPRLVLGLMLKALNHSANDPEPTGHTDLVEALQTLRSQVKVYDSTSYLQSLVIGDIALGVGWSKDIQPLISRYRYLKAVAPSPATLLSADIWVRPNTQADGNTPVTMSPIDQQWLTYWWQPKVVTTLGSFSQGLSPRLLSPASESQPDEWPPGVTKLSAEQIEQSEFIEPLEAAAIAEYDALWRELRRRE